MGRSDLGRRQSFFRSVGVFNNRHSARQLRPAALLPEFLCAPRTADLADLLCCPLRRSLPGSSFHATHARVVWFFAMVVPAPRPELLSPLANLPPASADVVTGNRGAVLSVLAFAYRPHSEPKLAARHLHRRAFRLTSRARSGVSE